MCVCVCVCVCVCMEGGGGNLRSVGCRGVEEMITKETRRGEEWRGGKRERKRGKR